MIGQLTTILNSHWLKMITRFCLTKKHPFEYSPTLHLIHSKLAHPLQPGPLQFRVCVVALIMWLWSSKRMLSPAAPLTIKCGTGFKLLVPCTRKFVHDKLSKKIQVWNFMTSCSSHETPSLNSCNTYAPVEYWPPLLFALEMQKLL